MRLKHLLSPVLSLAFASPLLATNGMNIEGYGPIAAGMGGASQAFDNGLAAMMNNPATLALGKDGHLLNIAVGSLGPEIEVEQTLPDGSKVKDTSSSDLFVMPAFGYGFKDQNYVVGIGVFSQGGMGAEYDNPSLTFGEKNIRSEVGVARLIIPAAYKINDDIAVGGSLDYVQANMDLRMALSTQMLGGMVTGSSDQWGQVLQGLGQLPQGSHAVIEFNDSDDMAGAATSTGYGAKLGVVYKVMPELNLGLSYHSQTFLSDMEGDAVMRVPAAGFLDAGKIKVKDFQWPAQYAFGAAYSGVADWLFVFDVKHIAWSSVMEKFKMTYKSDTYGEIDFEMEQKWEDQTVFQLGSQYMVLPELALRAGLNVANNPVPDSKVNILFPATVENHLTAGAGYAIAETQAVDFSVVRAFETTSENKDTGSKISHAQTNFQLMYGILL